ncbi:MAG TPA: HEAT repeat domain-containing protein, partial [Chthonomonadaceae bacterium]|nr:HEAT repeat domain-containing protein [Chthonomonadaceae bacterium]
IRHFNGIQRFQDWAEGTVRKYLNYIVFGVIVCAVVAFAIYHTQHIRSLIDAMSGSDPKAQEQAALELVQGEQFIDTVTGEPVKTRVKAAESLEFVANDKSIKKGPEKDAPDYRANAINQAVAMLKDLDKPVRDRAVLTLQRSGASSAANLAALVSGLKDGDNYVRKGTKAALTDPVNGIGPKLDPADGIDVIKAVVDLMKKEAGARGPGGDVLASDLFKKDGGEKRSGDLLIAQLGDSDGGVRQGAADALGKLGYRPAVEPLTKAMHSDSDPQVRRVAIGALALIADPACEQTLVVALNDTNADNEARAQAASGLGRLATPRAVGALIKTLDDDDLKLRSAAVAALAHAARPDPNAPVNRAVLADLVSALQGKSDDARTGAAAAFVSLHATEANGPLIVVLKDTARDSDARTAAATALGFPGNAPAVDPLVQALHDPDGDVDTAARDALAAIGPAAVEPLISVMQTDGAEAYYATQALASQGAAAIPALQRVADGNNRTAQHWAAVALGSLSSSGVRNARPLLVKLAKSTDDDVQYVANEQLHRLDMH